MEKYLGQEIPKLGFGLMRLPKNPDDSINIKETSLMVDLFLESGFTYFDTAWGYPGSEEAIGKALFDRYKSDREKFTFATKLPAWRAENKEEAEKMLETSLERTGCGYIDFYLLHNLGEHRTKYFNDYDIWSYVQKKKEEGILKNVGFSFHDKADKLDQILTDHPEMDFVQLQINYADWENPAVESKKCYQVARKHNKPLVIMEPIKGGSLAKLPDKAEKIFKEKSPDMSIASWAIRFCASLEGVITVLSGMSSLDQMKDNISYMKGFKPLTEEEEKTVEEVRKLLESYSTIPCTSCDYCADVCPKDIGISGIFEATNIYQMYDNLEFSKSKYYMNTDNKNLSRASACIKCGACEEVCPQHIEIREELEKAKAIFE